MNDGNEEPQSNLSQEPNCITSEVRLSGNSLKNAHHENIRRRKEEECSVLDLSYKDDDLDSKELCRFDCLDNILCSQVTFQFVRVLLLRNNLLPDLAHMNLSEMRCLTDLDLACNNLVGEISNGTLPPSLEKLDISENYLESLSGLICCPNLITLNISNNCIRAISVLPPKLVELDISNNKLTGITNLRHLSLSPQISSLKIQGNPVVEPAGLFRATVKSILTKLEQLDGQYLPGHKLRKHKPVLSLQVNDAKKPKMSGKQQKESDLLRHEEYFRRLEEWKIQNNLKNYDIDKNSHSRSPTMPTKADQMLSDYQRTNINSARESILDQERENILGHLTAQYRRKPTITKESNVKIITKTKDTLPGHKDVRVPTTTAHIPVASAHTSPRVRVASPPGSRERVRSTPGSRERVRSPPGVVQPTMKDARDVKYCNNGEMIYDNNNGCKYHNFNSNNSSNPNNHNFNSNNISNPNNHNFNSNNSSNPTKYHDRHNGDNESIVYAGNGNDNDNDNDNRNDVSDITHNNTVYSRHSHHHSPSKIMSQKYSPHEPNNNVEAIRNCSKSSRLNKQQNLQHDMKNGQRREDIDNNHNAYTHIYHTTGHKDMKRSNNNNQNRSYNENPTIDPVKYTANMVTELLKISKNLQLSHCLETVMKEEGILGTGPGTSSGRQGDSCDAQNTSEATTMHLQQNRNTTSNNNNNNNRNNNNDDDDIINNDNSNSSNNNIHTNTDCILSVSCESGAGVFRVDGNMKEEEKEEEKEKDVREMNGERRGDNEERPTTGETENNRRSPHIKKTAEVSLGDVVSLACEVAIEQNKEGLERINLEITNSSEKSRRDEISEAEDSEIREKIRTHERRDVTEADREDVGGVKRNSNGKTSKREKTIIEVTLLNGGFTVLNVDEMSEIDDVIIEENQYDAVAHLPSSVFRDDRLMKSHDQSPNKHDENDSTMKNASGVRDRNDGIKLTKNQKKKANRKKKFNLTSEETMNEIYEVQVREMEVVKDMKCVMKLNDIEDVDKSHAGDMEIFSSFDIGGIQSLYPTTEDVIFHKKEPSLCWSALCAPQGRDNGRVRNIGDLDTVKEAEKMTGFIGSLGVEKKAEETSASEEKRRNRGGVFTFADARAFLLEEEKKVIVKERDMSKQIKGIGEEENNKDKDRLRVAESLNFREVYVKQVKENKSNQEVKEREDSRKRWENDEIEVKEIRRKREEREPSVVVSHQVLEGQGGHVVSNRIRERRNHQNVDDKEKMKEVGKVHERVRGVDMEKKGEMHTKRSPTHASTSKIVETPTEIATNIFSPPSSSSSPSMLNSAICASCSMCSSIDVTEVGSGSVIGTGLGRHRQDVETNAHASTNGNRYRTYSHKLTDNYIPDNSSPEVGYFLNTHHSRPRTDSRIDYRNDYSIDPRSGLTSLTRSPTALEKSPAHPLPCAFSALHNSTTSSFRAKCSNVIEPFKLYKNTQREKIKGEKKKLRSGEANNYVKKLEVKCHTNEVPSGHTGYKTPDVRTDNNEREDRKGVGRQKPGTAGERSKVGEVSLPILPLDHSQCESDKNNTSNRTLQRDFKTQKEIDYEVERQREIESCFNWVKRASELLQHLPPSSNNSIAGDRRGQGQGSGAEMNLHLSSENIEKITTATKSIRNQIAVQRSTNMSSGCNDITYENLNRSSDTNYYHRADNSGNGNHSDKNNDKSKAISDGSGGKCHQPVESSDPNIKQANSDKDPTRSIQLEAIVTYFRRHLSPRSDPAVAVDLKVAEANAPAPSAVVAAAAADAKLNRSVLNSTASSVPSTYIERQHQNGSAEEDENINPEKRGQVSVVTSDVTAEHKKYCTDAKSDITDCGKNRKEDKDSGKRSKSELERPISKLGQIDITEFDLDEREVLSMLSSNDNLPLSELAEVIRDIMQEQKTESNRSSQKATSVPIPVLQISSKENTYIQRVSRLIPPSKKSQIIVELDSPMKKMIAMRGSENVGELESVDLRSSADNETANNFNREIERIRGKEREKEKGGNLEDIAKGGVSDKSIASPSRSKGTVRDSPKRGREAVSERGSESPPPCHSYLRKSTKSELLEIVSHICRRSGDGENENESPKRGSERGNESPKRGRETVSESPPRCHAYLKKSEISRIERIRSPKRCSEAVSESLEWPLPRHTYLRRSSQSLIPRRIPRGTDPESFPLNGTGLGGGTGTEMGTETVSIGASTGADKGGCVTDLLQPQWNGNISLPSGSKEDLSPGLMRVRTKIPGKMDSFSLRPNQEADKQYQYLAVGGIRDDENDFNFNNIKSHDDAGDDSHQTTDINCSSEKIIDNKDKKTTNIRQNALQIKLKKKINELDLKVQSWNESPEGVHDDYHSIGDSSCSSIRTLHSGSVLSCLGPLKIKNGEVFANDNENENEKDNGSERRKYRNPERGQGDKRTHLTVKEKLRIVLLEAKRKDKITIMSAQDMSRENCEANLN